MTQARRRFAICALIVALAGAVVLAHSAVATDHMGEAMAVCMAVVDAAALGAVALSADRLLGRLWAAGSLASWTAVERPAARGPAAPPWPRGSPLALQVLRL